VDARHFDRLARSLTERGSRRGLLGLLAALPLTGGVETLLGGDAEGKGRRKKKRSRRRQRRQDRERQQKQQQRQKRRKRKQPQQGPFASDEPGHQAGDPNPGGKVDDNDPGDETGDNDPGDETGDTDPGVRQETPPPFVRRSLSPPPVRGSAGHTRTIVGPWWTVAPARKDSRAHRALRLGMVTTTTRLPIAAARAWSATVCRWPTIRREATP
jgi:hypothetical protein